MVTFVEASIQDLVDFTKFMHSVRPDLMSKVVVGVEEHQVGDRNVVFHLSSIDDPTENGIFMLSAEYILEKYRNSG